MQEDPQNTVTSKPDWVSYFIKSPTTGKWVHTTLFQVPAGTQVHMTILGYDGCTPLRNPSGARSPGPSATARTSTASRSRRSTPGAAAMSGTRSPSRASASTCRWPRRAIDGEPVRHLPVHRRARTRSMHLQLQDASTRRPELLLAMPGPVRRRLHRRVRRAHADDRLHDRQHGGVADGRVRGASSGASGRVQRAGRAEPNHGLRIFLIWLVVALAADLLIWFVWGPHLPPGDMASRGHRPAVRHQGDGRHGRARSCRWCSSTSATR